jgi:VCBS repeat-containing protein
VLDGDAETVSVLMGSKGDGTIDNWGTVTTDESGKTVIEFEAGDVTATISSPNGDIGFNDYSGINKQDGFGLGVDGGVDDNQIDLGETLVIDFDSPVSNATVGLAGLGENFGGSIDAYAHWEAFDAEGNLIASGDVQNDGDEVNSFTIDTDGISQIVFSVTNTTVNSNFTVQYIELNAVTSDSFDYSVTDSGGKGSETATITFDIEPSDTLTAEHAPVALDDSAELMENTSIEIDVLANDSDIDGDDLTVSIHTDPEHGTVQIIDGKVVYTPDADYEGADTFTYTVTDTDGKTDTATVSLNVLHENEAPVITVENTETTVTYVSEEASYNNVIGLYTVNEAGEPVLVSILEDNGNYGAGNFQIDPADGDFGTYTGDGSDLHFFIIANGNVGDVDYDSIRFVDNGDGYTAQYSNGENMVNINRPVYFDNAELNPGNVEHFQTTVNADGSITIGVEDLAPATSDEDYDDAVMRLETGNVTFVEDGEAVSIAGDVTIADDDSSTMTNMTVTLTNPLASDVMSILGDLPEGITADTSVPYQITFTNTAADPASVSIADFETALKMVTFENTSQDPDETPREFTVSVTDDTGLTSNVADFTVNVESVNDAPVAGDDSYSTTEDIEGGITFDALVNDSDVEGDVSISTFEQPANGTVVLNADGTFTYTPDADFNGTDTFTYQVTDADGALSEPATVTIVVDPVNDAPVVTVNDVETSVTFNSINTGASYTNAFGVYFTDADGNPVSGEILAGDSKGDINFDLGTYDTAASNVHFFLISNIGAGGYEEGEVTFEMVNGKPVMSIDGVEVTKNVFYSDNDLNKDGKDHFAVTENADGSVTIAIEDLYGKDATNDTDFRVDVTETDQAAVFTEDGGAIHIVQDVTVTDVDDTTMFELKVTLENYQPGEDVLSIDENMLPDGIEYDITDGVITFTNSEVDGNGDVVEMSNEDFAQAVESIMYNNTSDTPDTADREFRVEVSDGEAWSNAANITVEVVPVNDAPLAVDDVNTISDVSDTSSLNIVIALDTSGSMFHDRYNDIKGDETRLQIALDSLKEMLGSYEPSEVGGVMLVEFFGDVSTNTGQNGVWLTYDEAMDLITNFEIPFDQNNLNTDYDSALQMIMDNYESSTADGSMPAADETVMYFLSDGSPQGSDYEDGRSNSNSISSSEAGVWNEFAGANFSNVYAVGIGVNAASSQLSLVAGENGQVLLVNDEHGLAETLVNIADTSKVIGNVLLNDTDPEDIDWSDSSNGTNVQLTVTGAEAGGETSDSVALDNMSDGSITVQGEYGTLTINSDGSYVYTLDTENPAVQAMGDGESALDKFSYTVADSEGATDIATLSITVNGINDAPVAADDYGTVTAAGAEAVDVTATVELTNETTAGGANSDIDLTGVVVTDLGDLSLNFNINGGAERNFYMVGSTEGGNNINAGDGNDIFLLNGPINGNTAIAGGSGHDILILGGSQSDYTFQNYTNNNGMINTQIIDKGTGQMITVNEIEEIRFGGYSEGNTEYDVVITTDPAGAEVDSFTITVTNATLSAGTDNGDGTWTVSADEVEGLKAVSTGGTVSVGEITFELADGYTGVDAGSDESVILTGDVLANDSDPDGDSLSVTDVDGSDVDGDTVIDGEYGTLTINSDGTYTYELDSDNTDVKGLSDGQTLTETFTYTISDGKESSSADLNITINGANEAPVVTDAYVSGDEDTAIRIDVSGDFSDAEGPASITEFTQGANGSVVQNSDGTFSYTPADDFSGEDSFTYTVTDADGATSTATVNVTVNPVADAPIVSLGISEAVTESTANLIVNGSFEDVTGIKPNGGYSSSNNINSGSYKAMHSIPGWELVGEASETSNTMEIHNAGHMSVGSTDGTNYMDLGETNSSNDGDRDNTHIGQVISGLENEESYTLTFDYVDKAAIANNPASGAMQVIWGGEVIATITGDNTTWESYTVDVVGGAGNGNDRLEFKEIGTAYDNHGIAIDNVQLVATPDSVEFTLTLDAAVTDLNGAVSYESLESLTLSGLPEGAELSIGTDNGDGTWTISVENLTTYHGEVTMTVPAGTADFDLTLSAAAVESGNGDVSELAEAVVHVDVPGEAVVANEAPFIDLNGPEGLDFSEETVDYSTTYTMGSDQGVAIAAADLYIQDMDDTTLTSMTIAITGNFDALDTLNIDETALGGGLKVTYSEDGTSMTIASEDGSAVGIEHFENALGSVTFSTESDSLDARDISVTVADGTDSTITTTAHTSVSIDVPAQEYTPEIHSLDGNFDAFGHRGGNYGNSNEYAPTGNNAEAINEDGFYAVRSVNESNNNSEDFDIETSESISFHIHDDVTSATFEFYNADSDATDSGVGSTTWLIYDANGDAIDPSHASVTFDGTTATFTSDVPFQYIVFDAGNSGNGHSNNDPAIDPDGTGDVNFIVKPVEYQAADTYDMVESTLDTGSIDFSNVESYGHIDLINMSDDDAAQIINTLNVDDVLGLTDEDHILTITGGEGDQVQMSNDWSYDNQTGTFTANDGSGAEVHIQGSFDFDPASKIITFDDNNSNDGCQG